MTTDGRSKLLVLTRFLEDDYRRITVNASAKTWRRTEGSKERGRKAGRGTKALALVGRSLRTGTGHRVGQETMSSSHAEHSEAHDQYSNNSGSHSARANEEIDGATAGQLKKKNRVENPPAVVLSLAPFLCQSFRCPLQDTSS